MQTTLLLPSAPDDSAQRHEMFCGGRWSDLEVAFYQPDGQPLMTLSLHAALIMRCRYFWRALQPAFMPVVSRSMRITLPPTHTGPNDAWEARDLQQFLAWVYLDSPSWPAAWRQVFATCMQEQPLSATAVGIWLRQHTLASYFGFDAYLGGTERVLGGWHLDAIARAYAATSNPSEHGVLNESVASLLAACAANAEGRRRLLMRLAAWATTVLASLDANSPTDTRAAWIEAIGELCGAEFCRNNSFLAPSTSAVSTVCIGCFKPLSLTADKTVDQVLLDRRGHWRLLRDANQFLCLYRTATTPSVPNEAVRVEYASLSSDAGIAHMSLRAQADAPNCYNVPVPLAANSNLFYGRCMHCSTHGPVTVAAIRADAATRAAA